MPDETFIPFGTSALTQGLFYTTALSSWTNHTPPAVSGSHEADAGDGDDDDSEIDTLSDPAEPPVRGANFHLGADRNLSRGWPARVLSAFAPKGIFAQPYCARHDQDTAVSKICTLARHQICSLRYIWRERWHNRLRACPASFRSAARRRKSCAACSSRVTLTGAAISLPPESDSLFRNRITDVRSCESPHESFFMRIGITCIDANPGADLLRT